MSIVYRPITFDELASLIELPDDLSGDSEALSEIIAVCGSFLAVLEDTIVFVHQSAKESLLTEAQNGVFARGIKAEQRSIFSRSLQVMFKTLQRDIFQIKLPGFPIEKVIPPSLNPLSAAQYACVYWVDHLHQSGCHERNDLSVDERRCVRDFLYQVKDASRFIRYNRLAIESSPLQVYSSSLIFTPILSTTRACYQRERPNWVLNEPLVNKDWSQCLQTLEGHNGSINSIAWSQDGSRLASASDDNTVKIWDPATGQCALTLEGHSDSVFSIAWSQDGGRLASASDDNTIRIWNTATGQCESTFVGHSQPGFVQFDKFNLKYLCTSYGTFDIGFTGTVTSTCHFPEQYGYGLNDDHSWITYNGANLLWLPTEYRPIRPSQFAMSATKLAIACSSGVVIFLALTEQSPISGL